MTTPIGDILEFACKHPDYWSLLVPGEDPEELELLDEERRQAFEAAREEVRRKVTALIRAAHRALQARAAAEKGPLRSRLVGVFSRTPTQTSFNKGGMYWNLLYGRGKQAWVCAYFWVVTYEEQSRIEFAYSVQTSKSRAPLVHAVYERLFDKDYGTNDEHGWVGTALEAGRSVDDTADKLVERGWPAMLASIEAIEAAAASDE